MRFPLCLFPLFALGWCGIAGAQALPAASREPLEVGAAFSFGSPGYQDTTTYVEGFTLFADAPIKRRLSAEVDWHYDSVITPIDVGEDTFLVGPRFSVIKEDRANIYVKVMGGVGHFDYQKGIYANPHVESYGVLAFGAGIEYRISRYLNLRAVDLEFQKWPGFQPSGITPVVASTGLAYRF